MSYLAAALVRGFRIAYAPSTPIADRLDERDLLHLVTKIAKKHKVSVADVCSRVRTRTVAAARHAVWVELRDKENMTLHEIGRLFDRDHSTVLAAVSPNRKAKSTAQSKAYWLHRKGVRT